MPIPQMNRSYVDQLHVKLQGARSGSRETIILDPMGDRDLTKAFHNLLLRSMCDGRGLSAHSFVSGPTRLGKSRILFQIEGLHRESASGNADKIPYRQTPISLLVSGHCTSGLVDGTVQPAAARLDH